MAAAAAGAWEPPTSDRKRPCVPSSLPCPHAPTQEDGTHGGTAAHGVRRHRATAHTAPFAPALQPLQTRTPQVPAPSSPPPIRRELHAARCTLHTLTRTHRRKAPAAPPDTHARREEKGEGETQGAPVAARRAVRLLVLQQLAVLVVLVVRVAAALLGAPGFVVVLVGWVVVVMVVVVCR